MAMLMDMACRRFCATRPCPPARPPAQGCLGKRRKEGGGRRGGRWGLSEGGTWKGVEPYAMGITSGPRWGPKWKTHLGHGGFFRVLRGGLVGVPLKRPMPRR